MNIIEAVRSGRPFTRSGWPKYLRVISDSIYYASADPTTELPFPLLVSDIEADDWFLEPQPKRKVKKTGWVARDFIGCSKESCEFMTRGSRGLVCHPVLVTWEEEE